MCYNVCKVHVTTILMYGSCIVLYQMLHYYYYFTCGLCCISFCALSVMYYITLEDMFSMHSTLSTLVMDPKTVFLSNLISLTAGFNIGIINSCGCLFLMLCNTSKGMRHLGSCLSRLISDKLLIFRFHGVFMEIHVIDLLCKCVLTFGCC